MTKLYPSIIRKILTELDEVAGKFGGRPVDNQHYYFPPSLGESARMTAEAAAAMHACLRRNDREIYGATVLVGAGGGEGASVPGNIDTYLLRVPDDNGLWLAPDIADEFLEYLEMSESEGLYQVHSLREAGLRLEERLPRLLVRPDRLPMVRKALETMEREPNGRTVLLLRGNPGSGKRSTLGRAMKELYPDDGGSPLVIPFSEDGEDPMEPFIRALKSRPGSIPEYLDEEDCRWWESEGEHLVDTARRGLIWNMVRDHGPVDLIQAFTLHLKAHVECRRSGGRPAYVVVDGFVPESEAVCWLRSLLSEFSEREPFRLILIRDSDDFDELLPIPGKGHEVGFRTPSDSEWRRIVSSAALDEGPGPEELAHWADRCGADLYRLFHALLARESGAGPDRDPGELLVSTLDGPTRRTLFLAHAAAGLADRDLISHRFRNEDERSQEYARYDSLVDYGLIRDDPDGRVRGVPGGPVNASSQDLEVRREAEAFGKYLFERFESGDSIDLFRLFRYLEVWGPAAGAIAVLDRLLDSLLTQRRLGAAGRLLTDPPFPFFDLDGTDMEALQNVIGAARLRYILLTGDAEEAREWVREGGVSSIGGRGAYSDRFRLYKALLFYVEARWDKALAASREALFAFQRSGDHNGETRSHLELALALLALGKIRDAQKHFAVARRIGAQIGFAWGVLRASSMECVTQFLFGNLSRADRESREHRELAHREGRRDLWLLLTLVLIRISWDLGRYAQVVVLAEEGIRAARFYNLKDEVRVMTLWKGRGLIARGDEEGETLLNSYVETDEGSREALAFLAESSWLEGDMGKARRLIHRAVELKRRSVSVQSEADDWSDGFYPIEGRLAGAEGPSDVLGEWISGFDAYLAAEDGDESAVHHLDALLDQRERRILRPFSHLYGLWASLAVSDNHREAQTRYMSRAFSDLQTRAGRFGDNQTKQAWLTANPWNKRLMDEAQRQKLL